MKGLRKSSNGLIWAVVILLLVVHTGCEPKAEYVFVREIPGGSWAQGQRLGGEFEVSDTINPYHFYVTLRNTADYPYSNLYLFVHTYFPNGRKSRDTVECILADRAGRWLGSGNGFIFDQKVIANKVMYKYQKKFPLQGEYKIELEHAMRPDTLHEILDVGVRIEQVEN